MRAPLAVLLAAAVMVVAGCATTIRADGAARSVSDLVAEQTGFRPSDVSCPEGVDAEVGTTFECTFTGPEGEGYIANMRVTRVEGDDVEFYIETRPS